MRQSTVTLKINNMPSEVRAFGFPCGETNCMTLANRVLRIITLDDEYELPLCAMHAQRLEKAIDQRQSI